MGEDSYTIKKLQGNENYKKWALEMTALLQVKELDTLITGEDYKPFIPTTSSTTPLTPEQQSRFDRKLQEWKRKNSKTVGLLLLNIEDGPQQHVDGQTEAKDVWDILRNQYESYDVGTRDLSFLAVTRCSQSEFSTMQEYGDHIKKHTRILANMGYPLSPWQVSTSFRLGLNPDLAPYTFQLLLAAKMHGGELDVDQLIHTMVDHEKRTTHQEGIQAKAMAARKTTDNLGAPPTNDRNRSRTPTRTRRDRGKGPCQHCRSIYHGDNFCYYLHPEQRPSDWRPTEGREHLMVHQKSGSSRNSGSDDGGVGVKIMRAFTSRKVALSVHGERDKAWWIDSAADVHMTYDKALFSSYKAVTNEAVQTAEGKCMEVKGKGDVILDIIVNNSTQSIRLTNVFHIPNIQYNLLSVGVIESKGFTLQFKKGKVSIIDLKDDALAISGTRIGTSYHVDQPEKTTPTTRKATGSPTATSLNQWHRRLGHLGKDDVIRLAGMATGMNLSTAKEMEKQNPANGIICEPCIMGKQHRTPSRDPQIRAKVKGELIHVDLAGGGQITPTVGGSTYLLTVRDDATSLLHGGMLKRKSEIVSWLEAFLIKMKNQGSPIQRCRADNEFGSKAMLDLFARFGVNFEPASPYNPEQNGKAERGFRTIFSRIRTLLMDSGLPRKLWGEAANTVIYLMNISPTKALNNKTPYEAWNGQKPDLKDLRVFGCVAYHFDNDPKQQKLDARSIKCSLLGYEGKNQFRLWNPKKQQVIRSSHVVFDETASITMLPQEEYDTFLNLITTEETTHLEPTQLEPDTEDNVNVIDNRDNRDSADTDGDARGNLPVIPQVPNAIPTRQSSRAKRPNYGKLADPWKYEKQQEQEQEQEHQDHAAFAPRACKARLVEDEIPLTWAEAMASPQWEKWLEAGTNEIESQTQNNTWKMVKRPPRSSGKTIIPGRWVFTIKRDALGNITKYKARWVCKGFHQVNGVDYDETYASVVKSMVWKSLLALGAKYDFEMEQMDVITAFLEALLKNQEIYVEQPHGFIKDGEEDMVCLLLKALYGLKQSPREWYTTLMEFLYSLDFTRSDYDHSVFIHQDGILLAIYVDDLLIIGPSIHRIRDLKEQLKSRFRMKDLGPVSYYLGMQITRDRLNRTIYINQATYTQNLVKELGLSDCHPCKIPMDSNLQLIKSSDDYLASKQMIQGYQTLIGSLMWAACMTRPDIALAVSRCSRYTNNPTPQHDAAAKKIVRYLAGTINLGLRYGPNEDDNDKDGDLIGFTDASYGDCMDTRRSTSGYVYKLWNGPISWSVKRQPTVAISTAEAEYIGQCNAGKEAIYLAGALHSLGYDEYDVQQVQLMADNQAAIKLSHNPVNHGRSKHIDIQWHFVRELVTERQLLDIRYVSTDSMVADGLTKPLSLDKFNQFVKTLGLSIPMVIDGRG